MLGHREMGFEEYLQILWRRLWLLVLPGVLVCAGAYFYSQTIPDRFTSQTLVLVEGQKVPDDFVRSVVREEINQRLGTMREQILSRSRLEPLISRFNLFPNEVGRVPTEDLVNRLRSAITVTPVQPVAGGMHGLPGFFINFTWSDPRLAQVICAEITSMFMEENLRQRATRAEETTAFLSKQLEEAKTRLDEQDARLADFKRRYVGQLPGQEQTNLNMLMTLTAQLDAVTGHLHRAQQDKTYAESMLAQQISAWEATQTGSGNPLTLEQQLRALQNQLVTLEARYTRDHPDVIKLKGDIATLQRKVDELAVTPPDPSAMTDLARINEPPQIQQLRMQIRNLSQTIEEKTREQARMQEQIRVYQARVQLSPVIEQEFKELTRGFEMAHQFYNELLSKRQQAEMATNLELRQQGEQFRVLDPANLPESPSYPDRAQFALGGLGVGLLLGAGIALLFEMRDQAIRSERDIEALLALPTLALVPTVGNGNGNGKQFQIWKKKHGKRAAEHSGQISN